MKRESGLIILALMTFPLFLGPLQIAAADAQQHWRVVSIEKPKLNYQTGGLGGGTFGSYFYYQRKTSEETLQKYGKTSRIGVKIEDAAASPRIAGPRDIINLWLLYSVLGSNGGTPIPITETREIFRDGKPVGRIVVSGTHLAGPYTSSVPLTLPGNVQSGYYEVVMSVQAGEDKMTKRTWFDIPWTHNLPRVPLRSPL